MSCLEAVTERMRTMLESIHISNNIDGKQRVQSRVQRIGTRLSDRASSSSWKLLREEEPFPRARRPSSRIPDDLELQHVESSSSRRRHRWYLDKSTGSGSNNPFNGHQRRMRHKRKLHRQMAQFREQSEQARRDLGEQMRQARHDEQLVLRLKRDYEAALEGQAAELDQLARDNDLLRVQLTRAAAKASRVPDRSPTHRAEKEVLDRWTGFAYDVRNFVMGHFGLDDLDGERLRDWAVEQGAELGESTPFYVDYITRPGYGGDLVQALVWNMLYKLVFGDAGDMPVLWAGKYAPWLSKMSAQLFRDLDLHRSDKHLPTYHHWRTQTTVTITLASSSPPAAQTQHGTSPADDIVKSLERTLSPIRNPSSTTSLRPALQRIVHAAVELDQLFWGQDAWYFPQWPGPGAGRHGFAVDEEAMKVVGGVGDSDVVSFVVQPSLCRIGGEMDKKYKNYCVLEKSRVWV